MATAIRPTTLRRLLPRSRFPVARELADVGNFLGSARLLALVHKVRDLETDAGALRAQMGQTGKRIAQNGAQKA